MYMNEEVSEMKIVPDTSVIIDGRVSAKIKSGEYSGANIYVPEAVISELEAQANKGIEIGYRGLDELKELRKLADSGEVNIFFVGDRPTLEQIRLAKSGEIDAIIRSVAIELDAMFVTGDRVQAQVAIAKGLNVDWIFPQMADFGPLLIDRYFTDDTMSVHLKKGVFPMAKRGTVGDVRFIRIGDEPCSHKELKDISRELIERARADPESFLEMSYSGVSILQIRNMRIAISNPPFSDDTEITAVRPIASVSLDEYRLNAQLKERILSQRGILISGPPGSGKSTFAAGIATYLGDHDFVVKTMESPRDLQVPKSITQYAPLDGDMENTADVLLLVRPDYTIYDEVRKTRDFLIFADMRLAGVGMIGVVHANRAIDAIQRLIGRLELGVIPQVVDTVIFLEKGEIVSVYILEFTVKVPFGMTEDDLARPVITVSDFETGATEYEIYTYGEQVVVMPVGEESKKPSWKLAEMEIRDVMRNYVRGSVNVEMVSDQKAVVRVSDADIPRVIGKGGAVVAEIEKALGIHIDVRKLEEKKKISKGSAREYYPVVERTKKHVIINVPELSSQDVEIYANNNYLFTATISRHGDIKIRMSSTLAQTILDALDEGEQILVKEL
ncbi:PilT protein domain protein [Methanosalsum zhilinae DSM 4017]|uniref:PilT protein domain protein n=2 Tax=Methanosalsum zhilinae TaxID=39669 RepID=F7XMJ8_METZD|nr:PilT protein domain protein [Methanosalsum zhilinae DSM 4017]